MADANDCDFLGYFNTDDAGHNDNIQRVTNPTVLCRQNNVYEINWPTLSSTDLDQITSD